MADRTKKPTKTAPATSSEVTEVETVEPKKEKVKFAIPPLVTVSGEPISDCYTVLKEFRTVFNASEFNEKIAHVLLKYDFIVGDFADNQLRLKGFYRDGRRDTPAEKRVAQVERYIKHSCNYMSPHYVLEKTQRVDIVETAPPPKRKPRSSNSSNRNQNQKRPRKPQQPRTEVAPAPS